MNSGYRSFCHDCGIPVEDFLIDRKLQPNQVLMCPSCAALFSKQAGEIAKINGVCSKFDGSKPHLPRWNYPGIKSHRTEHNKLTFASYNWDPKFLDLPLDKRTKSEIDTLLEFNKKAMQENFDLLLHRSDDNKLAYKVLDILYDKIRDKSDILYDKTGDKSKNKLEDKSKFYQEKIDLIRNLIRKEKINIMKANNNDDVLSFDNDLGKAESLLDMMLKNKNNNILNKPFPPLIKYGYKPIKSPGLRYKS